MDKEHLNENSSREIKKRGRELGWEKKILSLELDDHSTSVSVDLRL